MSASELELSERFALGNERDREVFLAGLVAGTGEHFYFSALHALNTGNLKKAKAVIRDWKNNGAYHPKRDEIENRWNLLQLAEEKDPESLKHVTDLLGVQTSHGRRGPGEKVAPATFASVLEPSLVDTREQVQVKLKQNSSNLSAFSQDGIEFVASTLPSSLTKEQRRDLLDRVSRPDVDNLVQLIEADMKEQNTSFGNLRAHNILTQAQLAELAHAVPRILAERSCANLLLTHLAPSSETHTHTDSDNHVVLEYLESVRAAVLTLPPAQLEFKASALLLHLAFLSRKMRVYDTALFMEYIKIPRRQNTVNPQYLRSHEGSGIISPSFSLPAAGFLDSHSSDTEVITQHLHAIFEKERERGHKGGKGEWDKYLEPEFCKRTYAEWYVTHPKTDVSSLPDDIASALGGHTAIESLRNRSEISFAPHNKTFFTADEEVTIDVLVKNVDRLTIKVFEMNTFSYYKDNLKEIPSDVNLDGLVPSHTTELTYSGSFTPIQRHLESLSFSQLKKGVYVMELQGSGISSRAVFRKGRLFLHQRTGVAGVMVRVVDENNLLVEDATVYLDGHMYGYSRTPEGATGEIQIPFRPASSASDKKVILCSRDIHSLASLDHSSESYNMSAGFYVDRESLLAGNHRAQVLVRPALFLNALPVTASILKNVVFEMELVDSQGVATSKKEEDLALEDSKELVRSFAVPENTRQVRFTLTASVNVLSNGNQPVSLSATETYEINGTDDTDNLEDVHLVYGAGNTYELKVLGRSGEPKANRVVNLEIQHRFLNQGNRLYTTLQSSENGSIQLGPLKDISAVIATLSGSQRQWTLDRDTCTLPAAIHQRVGTPVCVPFLGCTSVALTRRQASLLRMGAAGTFQADVSSHLSLDAANGYLVVDGKLSPGDYSLSIKTDGAGTRNLTIRITRGLPVRSRSDAPIETIPFELKRVPNPYPSTSKWQCDRCFVMGSGEVYHHDSGYDLCINCQRILTNAPGTPPRALELSGGLLMQIASVVVANDEVVIKIANPTADTRVHVFCPRLVQDFTLFTKFEGTIGSFPLSIKDLAFPESSFSAGRRLGDEQLYILSRQEGRSKHRPGNMLVRPSLLLNPVEIRSTETKRQEARSGEALSSFGGQANERMSRSRYAEGGMAACDMLSRSIPAGSQSTNVDFLAEPLVLASNLVPGASGIIRIPLASINALRGGIIVVYASNDEQAVVRHIRAPGATDPSQHRDLRMLKPLSTSQHFTEQRRAVSVVKGKDGGSWSTSDVATTTYTVYDTLSKVYSILSTLLRSGKEEFSRFSFLPRWGRLPLDEKLRHFSEFACHELNFFLFRKDKDFFASVVRPYLVNKSQKTLVDRLLLGEPLDGFSEISRFGNLNVFEQVLLALGNQKDARSISESLSDRAASQPIDLDLANLLFDTALKATAMDEVLEARSEGESVPEPQAEAAMMMAMDMPAYGAMAMPMMMALSAPMAPMTRAARSAPSMMKKSMASDMAMREGASLNQMFRAPDKTKELGERNYWQSKGEPIQPNFGAGVSGFWADVGAWACGSPSLERFASSRFLEACNSANEALLVLALLDIPYQNDVQSAYEERGLTLTSTEPFVVFSKQIQSANVDEKQAILVHENFFDTNDAFVTRRDGEREDKFLKDEALVFTVYGCRVVLTNVSSTNQKLNLLLQVPQGAIPVRGCLATRSLPRQVGPYSTLVEEYYFYFPKPGHFVHYPAHVARDGVVCGWAHDHEFHVVSELSAIDATSWVHVASAKDPAQMLRFLAEQSLNGIDLSDAAWHMREKRVFLAALDALRARKVFSQVLWGYGFMHSDDQSVREYLHNYRSMFGPCIASPLLTLAPEETYTHTEFDPVINARAHRLGEGRVILNDRIKAQYESLLNCLSYLRVIPESLVPAVVYHLLLQDRIEEGAAVLAKFAGAGASSSHTVDLQLDYLRAYMDFFSGNTELPVARRICAKYAEYPVKRWKKLFDDISAQLHEIDTGVVTEETQENTAIRQPSLDFVVEGSKIRVRTANLAGKTLSIRFFSIDIELLFSTSPFMSHSSGQQFLYVKPNKFATVVIPESPNFDVEVDEEFRKANVVIEISAEGLNASQPVFSNTLNVQVSETFGQVRVSDSGTAKPVVGAYIKAYVKYRDGRVAFYKDGYCDLRGRFDYVSLTTKEENIERFAILVHTSTHGSLIREAKPPSTLS